MVITTLSVTGMMCPKCEAHMNEAIKAAFKVKSVESSHKDNKTVITSKEALDEKLIADTVAGTGYKLEGISVEVIEKKGFSPLVKFPSFFKADSSQSLGKHIIIIS